DFKHTNHLWRVESKSFGCGTGLSKPRVVLGLYHTVTVFRRHHFGIGVDFHCRGLLVCQ
ncbi:hypothetical protein SK128_025231, partial [Halocaridina rubra]